MNTVEKILDLFDELDGYESVDLIEALEERGYELKINHNLEKTSMRTSYALFLETFAEINKIQTIKLIRNSGPENNNMGVKYNNWGLREAKDFVDDPQLWASTPFVWGKRSSIKILQDKIKHEFGDTIKVKMKEYII
jgi:ribosomal protein L7/L12